jgi:hypothetical protein
VTRPVLHFFDVFGFADATACVGGLLRHLGQDPLGRTDAAR